MTVQSESLQSTVLHHEVAVACSLRKGEICMEALLLLVLEGTYSAVNDERSEKILNELCQ